MNITIIDSIAKKFACNLLETARERLFAETARLQVTYETLRFIRQQLRSRRALNCDSKNPFRDTMTPSQAPSAEAIIPPAIHITRHSTIEWCFRASRKGFKAERLIILGCYNESVFRDLPPASNLQGGGTNGLL
ncbi:hypothetical protein SLS58_000981 [Diplodia intermedia]|uniref:Uncharacterized protein n=1 Tax=Diplodia intermedia TaxID=856260 RepID=A0ABR3U481_9PEZI